MILAVIVTALAVLSLVLTLWQYAAGIRHPLDTKPIPPPDAPGITLLKPLKGVESSTRDCLETWLSQDYPGPVQILFGVASPEDPVCEVVKVLLAANSQIDAQIVVCPEIHGPNAKVSTLVNLEKRIRHSIVVVSDADVSVPPGLLADLAERLRSTSTGLVCCLYRLEGPVTLAMRMEAAAVNADFWSGVLQARQLKPMDFGLGAVMATTTHYLSRIGGFRSLVDYLADDYQLGRHIVQAGGKVELSGLVAACYSDPQTWGNVWRHQLRWARTVRVCQPVPYFFSILQNGTFWPIVAAIVTHGTWPAMWMFSLACILTRMGTAMHLQNRITHGRCSQTAYAWLVPIYDLIRVGVWAGAFLGNHLEWRGKRFRVNAGGKLTPLQ